MTNTNNAAAKKTAAAIWATAVIAAFGMGYVVADGQPGELTTAAAIEADRQDAEAMASRAWVGDLACPPGTRAHWIGDKDLSCIASSAKAAHK